MKKGILFVLAFAVFVLAVFAIGLLVFKNGRSDAKAAIGCLKEAGTATMKMSEADSFDPQNIKIKKCTKVVFENVGTKEHWPASDLHPTHSIYPEFDPQRPVEPGDSWTFVFGKVGNWRYHDHLFPATRGTVTVEE